MRVIGDYEYDKKDKIGHGVFGKVYEGRNKKELDKVAAIKKVDIESHSLRSYPDSICRETGILRTLSNPTHKNIVTLFHCEQQAGKVYFVMEYCNGGNLQEYLKSKRKLDKRTLRNFLRQIAAGLRVAHDMHIVHRDLKPENILLCFTGPKYPDPDNITLKIADFGIGRFLADDEMARTLCGTPRYTAPEILVGRPHRYKVDLWSVGVIAYECLVGSLPTDSHMAFQDVEIPTTIGADFADLLKGLLEKDENKRFDIKQFFNHPFLASTISVSVVGLAKGNSKMVQVKDNQSVDHLIDIATANYRSDSELAYLIHEDGRPLERGSGKSLRESDIVHNNTVTLVLKLSGGSKNDGKAAAHSSKSISS